MFGDKDHVVDAIPSQRANWKRAVTTCCPITGNIVIEFWNGTTLHKTKQYGPTEFAHQAKNIAWAMGVHVTP